MGLVHKDNAVHNTDPPRHGSRLSADQQTVHRHVDKYSKSASDTIAPTTARHYHFPLIKS